MAQLALKLDRPLVVFDIESTGLNTRVDRIVELAAIKVYPDGTEESKRWLFNPEIHIPEETTLIHGYTDEDVKDCPTFAATAKEIFDFFEGCDLSGFNCDRFDIPCLESEFARVEMNFDSASRRHVDVQRIYHKMEPRDLTSAVRFYCNRDHAGAHHADVDTIATLEVLKAQMEKYSELPKTSAEMDEFLNPRDPLNADRNGMIRWMNGEWCFNFGQHRGKKIKDDLFSTDGDSKKKGKLLRWILNGNFDMELKEICRNFLDNGILPPPPKQQ